MEESRKHLMDKFQQHLVENYKAYCEAYHIKESYAGFVTYLIDHELIPGKTVKRYTVLKEYTHYLPNYPHKTAVVEALSRRFNISTRSVWTILKNDQEFEKWSKDFSK